MAFNGPNSRFSPFGGGDSLGGALGKFGEGLELALHEVIWGKENGGKSTMPPSDNEPGKSTLAAFLPNGSIEKDGSIVFSRYDPEVAAATDAKVLDQDLGKNPYG